ncbi:MAG: FecR domain-containing protein [bacterium]|nr:FecR domain-containing protein [bacterium]
MNEQYNVPPPTNDRFSNGEDSVARLLRLAGHRPAVPAQDAAIVKEAARAEWQRAVKARRRRNLYAGGGGLLAAAALLLLVLAPSFWRVAPSPVAAPVATLEATTGNVVITGQRDEMLVAGAVIETFAGGTVAATADLALTDGSRIHVGPGSRLELVAVSILDLERGTVHLDSDSASGSLEVRTPLGVARDIGTRFNVQLLDDGSLLLQVHDGEVELTNSQGAHRALAGQQIKVSASGTVTPGQLPPDVWQRPGRILPAYPAGIGPNPLPDFLDWVGEKCGLELEYANEEARAAAAIDRFGDVTGFSLDDVVPIALPSQLEHDVTPDGRLVIDWKPGDGGES